MSASPRLRQQLLFCPCGRALPVLAGLCRACYRARARDRARFAGCREAVLRRDGERCRGCGAGHGLHVHHRTPGLHAPARLITLCAACHARIHRLGAIRSFLPAPLDQLWSEQHRGAPRQLQLPLERAA
jgi:hypothetical protein